MTFNFDSPPDRRGTDSQKWQKYAGREYSASWFMVKMKRATRQITPIQPEYRPDIQRVLAEMKALPTPDRVIECIKDFCPLTR